MRQIFSWTFVVTVLAFFYVRGKPWYSDLDAYALLRKYSQEEVDHFAAFAFQEGKLKKWRKKICLKFVRRRQRDSITYEDTKRCVKELNGLLDEIRVKWEDKNIM